jgi:hypothetical protein
MEEGDRGLGWTGRCSTWNVIVSKYNQIFSLYSPGCIATVLRSWCWNERARWGMAGTALDEIVKTWPLRPGAAIERRIWWQPTLDELRVARKAAARRERKRASSAD